MPKVEQLANDRAGIHTQARLQRSRPFPLPHCFPFLRPLPPIFPSATLRLFPVSQALSSHFPPEVSVSDLWRPGDPLIQFGEGAGLASLRQPLYQMLYH